MASLAGWQRRTPDARPDRRGSRARHQRGAISPGQPVPGNDESHEVIWVDLREVSAYNNNRSTLRMVEKTRRLHRALHR